MDIQTSSDEEGEQHSPTRGGNCSDEIYEDDDVSSGGVAVPAELRALKKAQRKSDGRRRRIDHLSLYTSTPVQVNEVHSVIYPSIETL